MILGGSKPHMDKPIGKLSCTSTGSLKLCSSRIYSDCTGDLFIAVEGAVYGEKHGHRGNASLAHVMEESMEQGFEKAVIEALHMEGEFAFAACSRDKLALARDGLGSRPLYYKGRDFSTSRFPDAHLLQPGEVLFFTPGGRKRESVRRLPPRVGVLDPGREVASGLVEAVKKRAEFAEDFGILYSGGLDSALIAKIASSLGYRPRLYMVGSRDSLDSKRAGEAGELLNLEVVFREVSLEEVKEALPQVIRALDTPDPLQISLALPLYFATSGVEESYLLTGQGGDELFGGYHRYLSMGGEELKEEQLKDILELHSSNLVRDCTVASLNGVEILSPFLDRRVIQIALSLSLGWMVGERRKVALREAARKLGLPPELALRRKKGHAVQLRDKQATGQDSKEGQEGVLPVLPQRLSLM